MATKDAHGNKLADGSATFTIQIVDSSGNVISASSVSQNYNADDATYDLSFSLDQVLITATCIF